MECQKDLFCNRQATKGLKKTLSSLAVPSLLAALTGIELASFYDSLLLPSPTAHQKLRHSNKHFSVMRGRGVEKEGGKAGQIPPSLFSSLLLPWKWARKRKERAFFGRALSGPKQTIKS